MDGSYAGWCAAHTCVTAAVAVLQPEGTSAGHLLDVQNADGSWSGHWWDDDEYTTARAIEALAARPGAGDAVAQAVAWCVERIGEHGSVRSRAHGGPSPFATALALHGIRAGALAEDREARARGRARRALAVSSPACRRLVGAVRSACGYRRRRR